MNFFKLAILTALTVGLLASCAGGDTALIGAWERESDFSPIAVISFDGKICAIKDATFGNTTQYQYTIDSKSGAFNLYKMEDKIESAKPSSINKYTVGAGTLQLASSNGPLTFRKKQ